ncbi:hypothetical protein QUF80_19780 [Desulfococcaceae bacterium HSG8]|nr:hypothetical protein [Desulfococcaceae bacterium HSG8]
MCKQFQKFFMALVLVFLISDSGEAKFSVKIEKYPAAQTPIIIGSDLKGIMLKSRITPDSPFLKFKWTLDGPGRLDGDKKGPLITYIPPDGIAEEEEQATITLTVKRGKKKTSSDSITLTLQKPSPPEAADSPETATAIPPSPTASESKEDIPRSSASGEEANTQKSTVGQDMGRTILPPPSGSQLASASGETADAEETTAEKDTAPSETSDSQAGQETLLSSTSGETAGTTDGQDTDRIISTPSEKSQVTPEPSESKETGQETPSASEETADTLETTEGKDTGKTIPLSTEVRENLEADRGAASPETADTLEKTEGKDTGRTIPLSTPEVREGQGTDQGAASPETAADISQETTDTLEKQRERIRAEPYRCQPRKSGKVRGQIKALRPRKQRKQFHPLRKPAKSGSLRISLMQRFISMTNIKGQSDRISF